MIEKTFIAITLIEESESGEAQTKSDDDSGQNFQIAFPANVATTWCIEQSKMEGDNQMSHTFSLFKFAMISGDDSQ